MRGCGEGEVGGSRAGRRALPGTGLCTPSSSLPGEEKWKNLLDWRRIDSLLGCQQFD